MGDIITVELGPAEALVLFELLSRLEGHPADVKLEHKAEQVVLWKLSAQLEKRLVQPFAPNYGELVALARNQLAPKDE